MIDILLADNARSRVELAGAFARAPEIVNALETASGADHARRGAHEAGARARRDSDEGHPGPASPTSRGSIDRRGRVVARVAARRERLRRRRRGPAARRRRARRLPARRIVGAERHDVPRLGGAGQSSAIRRSRTSARWCSATRSRTSSRRSSSTSLNVDVGFFLGDDDVASNRARSRSITRRCSRTRRQALSGDELARIARRSDSVRSTPGNDKYTGGRRPVAGRGRGAAARSSACHASSRSRAAHGHARRGRARATSSFGNFRGSSSAVFVARARGRHRLHVARSDRPLKRLAGRRGELAKGEQERLWRGRARRQATAQSRAR